MVYQLKHYLGFSGCTYSTSVHPQGYLASHSPSSFIRAWDRHQDVQQHLLESEKRHERECPTGKLELTQRIIDRREWRLIENAGGRRYSMRETGSRNLKSRIGIRK
jgi:hypothetical protein